MFLVRYTYMDTGSLYSIHIWIQVPCTLYMYRFRFLVFYIYMDPGSLYSINIWIHVSCTLYIYIYIQVPFTLHIYGYRFLVLCTLWIQVPCTLFMYGYRFLVFYTYMDTGSLYSKHIWIQVLNLNIHKYTLGASHAPPKL